MTLVKANPRFRRTSFPSIFDDFFHSNFGDLFHEAPVLKSRPLINIKEDDNGYGIELAAPGLDKGDFNVSVDKDILSISVDRKSETTDKKDNYTRKEFSYQSFKRSFHLPETVDASGIDAKYENGVLLVVLPKKEEAKPQPARTIEIA
ncbi:MAG: Hsp20/alpha crystallin family protein [Bacteroidota bacterium]